MLRNQLYLIILLLNSFSLFAVDPIVCVDVCDEWSCKCFLNKVDYQVYNEYDRLPFPKPPHKTVAYPKQDCSTATDSDSMAATTSISVQITKAPWPTTNNHNGDCTPITTGNYSTINGQLTSYQSDVTYYDGKVKEKDDCIADPANYSCDKTGGVCNVCLAIDIPPVPVYPTINITAPVRRATVRKYNAVACWSNQPGCSVYCSKSHQVCS